THFARSIERIGITKWAVERKAVVGPAYDWRVIGGSLRTLAVGIAGGVIIHMVSDLIAQHKRIGVVMILPKAGRVALARIKRSYLVDVCVPVPDQVTRISIGIRGIGRVCIVVGKGIAHVIH